MAHYEADLVAHFIVEWACMSSDLHQIDEYEPSIKISWLT